MSKCVRKSRSLWNSCPISWQWNRRTITCQFALSLVNNQELFELHFLDNLWWWNLGVWISLRNKSDVLPVTNSIIFFTKEGATGEVQFKTMLIVFFSIDGQTPWEVAHQQLNFPHTIKDPCLQACHNKCIFGKTHFITATPSILPWLCSVWLLLVPIT